MSSGKARVTVTVDPHLVEAGHDAVAEGRVESLSAWVNLALAERVTKERRLRALAAAVGAYEAEFGAISTDEIAAQRLADRSVGVARPSRVRSVRTRRRRGAA
jgi:Arc/MetJ-type ribon-helix-helix transcriptional regulator